MTTPRAVAMPMAGKPLMSSGASAADVAGTAGGRGAGELGGVVVGGPALGGGAVGSTAAVTRLRGRSGAAGRRTAGLLPGVGCAHGGHGALPSRRAATQAVTVR